MIGLTEPVLYGSSLIEAKNSTITKMRGAFGANTVVHGNTNIELTNTTITDKIYVGSDTAVIKGDANALCPKIGQEAKGVN